MAGWAGAGRDAARPRGWSARQRHFVRLDDGIVSVAYEFAKWLRFFACPADWNETLWRLLGVRPGALTRHATTMALPCPLLATEPVRQSGQEARATELVDFAESARTRLFGDWVFDLARQKARAVALERPDDFTITEMIWHLVVGRGDRARAIARDVATGKRRASVVLAGDGADSIFEAVAVLPDKAGA